MSCAETAELIDLLFGVVDSGGPKEAPVQSYSPGGANVPRMDGTLAPRGEYDSAVRLLQRCGLIIAALWNRADHYIFAVWFLLSSSIFFSSPNLSRHRLNVCHTSTHACVALVRI